MELLELEFRTDHPPIRKSASSAASGALHLSGKELRPPHWKKGSPRRHPVSFTRGKAVSIDLTLGQTPASGFQIEGKSDGKYLNFPARDVGFLIKSGGAKIRLQASRPLPNHLACLTENITWTMIQDGKRTVLCKTGPHEFFVLWGKPITESSRWKMTNHLTYARLKLVTSNQVGGNKSHVDQIAHAIQRHVNSHAAKFQTNIKYGIRADGGQFWGLLGKTHKGQCAELSYLMELMNRILGIQAIQKHVRATTYRAGTQLHLDYEGHHVACESRHCAFHGKEELQMTFGYDRSRRKADALARQLGDVPYSINVGEGTCEVNGKLYAGALDYIGTNSGGRSPAHNVLLACEKRYAPNLVVSKKSGHTKFDNDRFQVWVTSRDKTGQYAVCEIDQKQQLKARRINPTVADPFPPVPK